MKSTAAPDIMLPAPQQGIPRWRPNVKKLRAVWREGVPSRFLPFILDPVWFWTLFGTYEDDPIHFDLWQIADLRDYSRVRIREKAPQIGFSWLRATEAVHEALLYEDVLSGFVSVDQREAAEKVLYARKLYDGLPQLFQRWVPLVNASQEELRFGDENRPSRVASYPATAGARGRRMSVTLDEVDFYRDGGKDAYRAAITRIMRGEELRVTMGSTCFGQDTELDRMMRGITEAGDVDDDVIQSIARYPEQVAETPAQRKGIELARKTLDPIDFAEEYLCIRGMTALDPFPAELIRRQTHEFGAYPADSVGRLIIDTDVPLVMGYDVGMSRNPSIASILERQPTKVWRQKALLMPARLDSGRWHGLELPEQQEWLTELMDRVRTIVLVIDMKGVGAQMTQALEARFGTKRVIRMVVGSKYGGADQVQRSESQDRDLQVTELKKMLEDGVVELLPDKEQAEQFRRTHKNPNGKYEQKGSRKETHFDRFWATAYAAYGVREQRGAASAYSRHGLSVVGGESRGRWG